MQGGLLPQKLVTDAIAKTVQKPLVLAVPELSAETSIRIARELMHLLDAEEPIDTVMGSERKFERELLETAVPTISRKFV